MSTRPFRHAASAFLVVLCWACLPGVARALEVDTNAGKPQLLSGPVHNVTQDTYYDTSQEAIDDANEGDVIEVSSGTYTEDVDYLGKSITLRLFDATVDGSVTSNGLFDAAAGTVVIGGAYTHAAGASVACADQAILQFGDDVGDDPVATQGRDLLLPAPENWQHTATYLFSATAPVKTSGGAIGVLADGFGETFVTFKADVNTGGGAVDIEIPYGGHPKQVEFHGQLATCGGNISFWVDNTWGVSGALRFYGCVDLGTGGLDVSTDDAIMEIVIANDFSADFMDLRCDEIEAGLLNVTFGDDAGDLITVNGELSFEQAGTLEGEGCLMLGSLDAYWVYTNGTFAGGGLTVDSDARIWTEAGWNTVTIGGRDQNVIGGELEIVEFDEPFLLDMQGAFTVQGPLDFHGPFPVEDETNLCIRDSLEVLGGGVASAGRIEVQGVLDVYGADFDVACTVFEGPGLLHFHDPLTVDCIEAPFLGNVQNDGTIQVLAGHGDLLLMGTYMQTSSGALDLELGGYDPGWDGYDQVIVAGLASLDGSLSVSLIDGFIPNPGDVFEVMTYGSRSGEFAEVTGQDCPGLPPCYFFMPVYESDRLVLQVGVDTVPADFDDSCFVDLLDYAHLHACLTGPGIAPGSGCDDADLDGDLDVDLAEFIHFQAAFDSE
jgi:hypothetical protein